jgi:hypothetical protein
MAKRDNPENDPTRRVSRIILDSATRKRILMDLGVEADIDWVPEVIHITRLDHLEVGLSDDALAPNSWVLVMV